MKFIDYYRNFNIFNKEDAFEYLMRNLKDTIYTYDFFVAWEKVFGNLSKVEVALNIMNSIIGKSDIRNRFRELIKSYPEIVSVIPLLIAVRRSTIKIVDVGGDIEYEFSKKTKYTEREINKTTYFAEKCGLLRVLADKRIKNLVDYYLGVEVGFDTNARKNRSGTVMENLTQIYIDTICNKHGLSYIVQATATKIKREFGRNIPIDKANRKFDFAISTGKNIYLVEANYYSGGGSKLKSVAGEFKSLFELITTEPHVKFIWVTDGLGWHTAKHPLLETYNTIDYTMNIDMIEKGFLEEIITKGL